MIYRSPAASAIIIINQKTLVELLDKEEYELIAAVDMEEKSIPTVLIDYLLAFADVVVSLYV